MQSPSFFAAITNRSILDQRFATSLSERTIPFLNDMARYVRERLSREGNTIATQKRLNKLLSDIEKRLDKIYSDITEMYYEEFRPFAVDEGGFTAKAMASVVVGDVVVETPSAQRLWAAVTKNPLVLGGNNQFVDFDELIESLGDDADKIAKAISGGYAQGQTIQEMTQNIVGTRSLNYKDGLIETSRRNAEAIVRTSINHIATAARTEVFEQNKDIAYGYRIKATLDTRTSVICRGYDGKVVRYSDRFKPMPPFHYNCRTTIVAEFYGDKLKETGATRAANFKARGDAEKGTVGQVSATQQYYDLLKRQPKSQQDLVLGKARGLIFRNAGLSADEFRKAMTTQMGKALSLQEMAEQNAKILRYMQNNDFLRQHLDE